MADDMPPAGSDRPIEAERERHRRQVIFAWLGGIAGIAMLVAGLVCAVTVHRPPVRPLSASQSMSDDEARTASISTVRYWAQARNNRDLPAVEALLCSTIVGRTLTADIDDLRDGKTYGSLEVLGFGAFGRYKSGEWFQLAIFKRSDLGLFGRAFILRVEDGELRLCDLQSMRAAGLNTPE